MEGIPLQLVALISDTTTHHLALITALFLATWGYCLKIKGFVSDDIEGLARFSDRFIPQQKDANGNITTPEQEIRTYEIEHGGVKRQIPNLSWNPAIEFPGCLLRWARLNWGKRFGKIGENSKGHVIYGFVQDARKHHLLNLIVQLANLFLGYGVLSYLFTPQLAFISMLIFAVHPIGVQTVGWISGVNYSLSLLGALATFYIAGPLNIVNPYILVPAIAFTTAFSCLTLLTGGFNWVILLLMGRPDCAIIAGLLGIFIAIRNGKQVVNFRKKCFEEQAMGKSTGIYWRKIIIMVKTFWYYVRLIPFPKRLGLFHTFGYHFEEPIEHIDKEFYLGLLSLLAYGALLFISPFVVQFGLIWMFIYLLTFSNFVTAQQFVSERYAFISTFGFSLVVGYYLQNYPVILAFLLGICIMRVWIHLPTFHNEVRFYESNRENFPTSEVAMGNLGVAYLNHGMTNKAIDTWLEASRQNPHYDVPWYNLYSIAKQNGDILGAKNFLQKCLNSKTVHFHELWTKEMMELDTIIAKATSQGILKGPTLVP